MPVLLNAPCRTSVRKLVTIHCRRTGPLSKIASGLTQLPSRAPNNGQLLSRAPNNGQRLNRVPNKGLPLNRAPNSGQLRNHVRSKGLPFNRALNSGQLRTARRERPALSRALKKGPRPSLKPSNGLPLRPVRKSGRLPRKKPNQRLGLSRKKKRRLSRDGKSLASRASERGKCLVPLQQSFMLSFVQWGRGRLGCVRSDGFTVFASRVHSGRRLAKLDQCQRAKARWT